MIKGLFDIWLIMIDIFISTKINSIKIKFANSVDVRPLYFRMLCWSLFNTLRLRQNGWHFPDDIVKFIFLNENIAIFINISLNYVIKGPINNIFR